MGDTGKPTEIELDLERCREWLKKRDESVTKEEKSTFVTISREFGCDGYPAALKLKQLLNERAPHDTWEIFTRPIMEKLVEDESLGSEIIDQVTEKRYNFVSWFLDGIVPEHLKSAQAKSFERLRTLILNLSTRGNCILVGTGAQILTGRFDPAKFRGFHYRIVANFPYRVGNVMDKFAMDRAQAEMFLEKKQNARDRFLQDFTMRSAADDTLYHAVFNNAWNPPANIAKTIVGHMEICGAFPQKGG